MSYPEITYRKEKALSLNDFKEMDYHAVEHFSLPIELMMENAGLHYNQGFEIFPGPYNSLIFVCIFIENLYCSTIASIAFRH